MPDIRRVRIRDLVCSVDACRAGWVDASYFVDVCEWAWLVLNVRQNSSNLFFAGHVYRVRTIWVYLGTKSGEFGNCFQKGVISVYRKSLRKVSAPFDLSQELFHSLDISWVLEVVLVANFRSSSVYTTVSHGWDSVGVSIFNTNVLHRIYPVVACPYVTTVLTCILDYFKCTSRLEHNQERQSRKGIHDAF